MKQRIRIFVRILPFYEPCVKAIDADPAWIVAATTAVKELARLGVPIRMTVS